MRTKLVIWGTNAKEERVLLALELLPDNNEVILHVFPQETATDEFVKGMMDEWRDDKAFALPEGHETIRRPLTIAESLLPEEFKVDRGDLIQRAQSEWAFVVLSHKLQKAFRSEMDGFRERIDKLEEFSQPVWEELKAFWEKVQGQVRERNLFREHVDQLRDQSNELFGQLKKLRQAADSQFRKVSSENAKAFAQRLEELHAKIEEGKHLIPTFEALKNLQREYHGLALSREDRNRIWDRMDAAFKLLKEKRFGGGESSGPASRDGGSGRIEGRLKGLLDAIDKMQKSISRDEKDLEYESRRAATGGQLESQLRQAKLAMIEDRVRSKREKLEDMEKTRRDLESRLDAARKRAEEEERKREVEKAKEAVKQRIAQEIEASGKELEEKAPELEEKARELAETKKAARPKAQSDASSAEEAPVAETPAPEVEAPAAEAPAVEEEVTPVAEAPAAETPAVEEEATPVAEAAPAESAPEAEAVSEAAGETPAAEETAPVAESAPEEEAPAVEAASETTPEVEAVTEEAAAPTAEPDEQQEA